MNNKTIMNRILSMFLTLMIAVTCVPALSMPAYADDAAEPDLVLVGSEDGSFIEGDPIEVIATCDADTSWVGLYKEEEEPGVTTEGGSMSLRWYWVKSAENKEDNSGKAVDLSARLSSDRQGQLIPGNYKIILFGDGGYSRKLKTVPITIIQDPNEEPPQPSDELTLRLVDPEKTTYKVGEEMWIVATGVSPGAWVGLFKEEETPQASTPSLRWFYIQDGYNGRKVNLMSSDFIVNNPGAITEGEYKILLYDADNYDNLIDEIHIKVEGIIDIDPDEFSIETQKDTYAYKEDILVRADGLGIGNSAWVGLYPADTNSYTGAYLYYYYVREARNDWTVIQRWYKGGAAGQFIGDGKYKFVVFADGGYSFPVKSVEFTVVREIKYRKVFRDPGCTTLGLEFVTYEDDTSEFREIPTLGGHIWGDPVKIDGKDVHKFTCARDPEHEKVEACKSAAEGEVIKPATETEEGQVRFVCDVCGGTFIKSVPKLKAPQLSATSFVYNGKTQAPELTIVDANGDPVDAGMYTVTLPAASKAAGSYTAEVKFKDRYSGTYKLSYRIVPKAVAWSKLTKGRKSFTAKWKRAAAQATGYQIAYSRNKNFTKAKFRKIKGIKKTSATVKRLKAGKKYYVRVRAYKVVKGKTYYSAWSKYRTVTPKK